MASYAVWGEEWTKNPATGGGDSTSELQNEYNVLAAQGVLCGTDYERYIPFDDAPDYEAYQEIPAWLKAAAGVAVAAIVGLAVGALVVATGGLGLVAAGSTAAAILGAGAGMLTLGAGISAAYATYLGDDINGTESSLGDYMKNSFSASVKVGGSILLLDVALQLPLPVKTIIIGAGAGYAWNRREDVIKALDAFIPHNVDSITVLAAYEAMSFLPVPEYFVQKNAEVNLKVLNAEELLKNQDYIENQKNWGNVQFGLGTHHNMEYSGCEIIATYNALNSLGQPLSNQTMVDLISYYERNGAALYGEFGTSPIAARDYFAENGYKVEMTTSTDPTVINALGERSDTIIATVYNDNEKISKQIHTVSITKEENGKFAAHNCGLKGECTSVNEVIGEMNGGKASIICLIGISKE